MLSIVGHFLCLFTLKRRFFVAEVALAQVALAEPERLQEILSILEMGENREDCLAIAIQMTSANDPGLDRKFCSRHAPISKTPEAPIFTYFLEDHVESFET